MHKTCKVSQVFKPLANTHWESNTSRTITHYMGWQWRRFSLKNLVSPECSCLLIIYQVADVNQPSSSTVVGKVPQCTILDCAWALPSCRWRFAELAASAVISGLAWYGHCAAYLSPAWQHHSAPTANISAVTNSARLLHFCLLYWT